ncbi:MAG TPA: FAD:protein FMN transferase [Opitutaceae bacterium]|nr:FAD:protein FMN transferase [Opitutaceae bacterium]HND60227.1 FAD:protein FMN transferase [Opitutaceae bacterium]
MSATATPFRRASLPRIRLRRWPALGTECMLQYATTDEMAGLRFEEAAVAWVESFEAKYSRFRPDSLVSQINASAGRRWVEVDEEADRLLDICAAVHRLSAGLLDATALPLMRLWDYRSANPRVPSAAEIEAARQLVGWSKVQRTPGRVYLPVPGMAIDLGGWGKEYAVDMVAELARRFGIRSALVDFGHDLRAVGAAPGKPAWHIGLEDPFDPGEACWGSLAILDRGVASSGDYRRGFTLNGVRYGHILDPRTGRPVAHGARQVTVIAPSCVQAGVLSTSAFILPPAEGIAFIQNTVGAEGCIVTVDARYQTRGFFNYVVPH